MNDTGNKELEDQIWVKIWKCTSIFLLTLVQRFQKENKNTTQLLEFQYILEDKTYDPWLLGINWNVKLSSTGVMHRDALIYSLLDKIFDKLELKILKHKLKAKANKRINKMFKM